MINLEYYKIFYQVAKYNNVTLAAKSLYLTQSAISHTINNLENKLQCKLFIRKPRGMTLSKEGKLLFEYIAPAITSINNGEMQILNKSNNLKGHINIAATETALYQFLGPILKKFNELNPDVTITITGTKTSDGCKELLKGLCDVAFLVSPIENNVDLEILKISEFHDKFCYSPIYFPQYRKKTFSLEDILKKTIICVDKNTSARNHIDARIKTNGYILKPSYNVRTTTVVMQLVKNGLGIGVAPDNFLPGSGVDELPVSFSIPPRSLFMLTNKRYQKSIICQKFIKMIKDSIEYT